VSTLAHTSSPLHFQRTIAKENPQLQFGFVFVFWVIRQHWGVENSLHWRLDVVMNEDQNRTAWAKDRTIWQCCPTWPSMPWKSRVPKVPSEESSNAPDRTTNTSVGYRRHFEMAIALRCRHLELDCSPHVPSSLIFKLVSVLGTP